MSRQDHRGPKTQLWAIILGGSKGLGLASAVKLAEAGYGIIVIHRDRQTDMPQIDEDFTQIEQAAAAFKSFNADAVNSESRDKVLEEIASFLPEGEKIKVLIHSIAKGHLKPMNADKKGALSGEDIRLTIQAMAVSLYDWTRALFHRDLFATDARVIAFTSEGSSRALPYYAAVSAAKAALEALMRSIALEFAPAGIKANCIQAGVTDTASLNLIPNSDRIKDAAKRRNPHGRLTLPEDVANVVLLLCSEEAKWITGCTIKADGGESLM